MPANDLFANAILISGTSGNTLSGGYNNNGAGTETGEPGHNFYNPGPSLPVANYTAGPNNTVWFKWVCPAGGVYFFSTLDKVGTLHTNFPTSCNVFTGSAVNTLTRVTGIVLDQTGGDGWGTDNGASIAFLAVGSTTYYIQIDSRIAGTTGNYILTWGQYSAAMLGSCGDAPLNFDTAVVCYGAMQLTYLNCSSLNADCLGYYSFGSSFPVAAGNYAVIQISGAIINTGGASPPTGSITYGGDYSLIRLYSQATAYTAGAAVLDSPTIGSFPVGIAQTTVPTGDNGPSVETTCTNDGGTYWLCTPTYTVPASLCQTVYFGAASGNIGIVAVGSHGWADTINNPTYQLLYYPFTNSMLSAYSWSSFTGSGTSWSMDFLITNNTPTTWDDCTISLLNTGGITGASAALTGVTLSASTNSSSGIFNFTADPTAGFVTATIQISRNGVVVGTLSYPLYPVVSAIINDIAFEEFTCTGFKEWGNQLLITQSYPTLASFPSAWGDTFGYVLSVVGGSPNLFDAHGAPCTVVSNLSGSSGGSVGFAFGLQAASGSQIVTMQCLFTFNGLSLPTFTGNVTVPPA